MNKLTLSSSMIAVTCLASIAGKAADNYSEKSRPNIILVMSDDQGWGDMGYYGHPALKTPNLDKMSKAGLRFDHFYSAAPVSSPTRGSVLTGRNPNRFGCFSWGRHLRPQEITVAEALKTVGYVTGHFGKWHLGSVFAGSPINPGAQGFDEWLSAPNFYDNDPILSKKGVAVQKYGESSKVTVDAAIDFIRKQAKSLQPFFSVVWFGSPHSPNISSEEFKADYSKLDPKIQNYYGEISSMDHAIGKLRDELKILGIDQNTILWFCSDNGGLSGLSNTGGRGQKGQIYEGGLWVPALLEWPARIKKNRVTNFPAYTSDIYPTLLEIANIDMNNQPILDGISLNKLIDNKMNSRKNPIGFWQYPGGGKLVSSDKLMSSLLEKQSKGDQSVDPLLLFSDAAQITIQYPPKAFKGHAALLDWPFKLHRIEDKNGIVKMELYNLAIDSMETNNLIEVEKAKAKKMMIGLEKWQSSVINSLNGEDYR